MLNEKLPAKGRRTRDTALKTGVAAITAAIGVNAPVIAALLQVTGGDVLSRLLSDKERSRIERTLEGAARLIEDDIKRGREPRSSGFEGAEPSNRPFSEEVAEGVLLRVQRENEERKLLFYEEFIRSYVFDPDLDPASARTLLATLSELSYRQCCVLALSTRQTGRSTLENDRRFRLRGDSPEGEGAWTVWEGTLLQEILDLEARRLVQVSRGFAGTPHLVVLSSLGGVLHDVVGLGHIDSETLDELLDRADPVHGRPRTTTGQGGA